jgi:hypothetical protein
VPGYVAREANSLWPGELVAVGISGLLVGHRARIAFATTSVRTIFAGATGVGVLALLLFLATGHVCLAAVLHVAASFSLVVVLPVC